MVDLQRCLNVADLQKIGAKRLPRPFLSYLESGSDDEATLADNRAAFGRYSLLPRMLAGFARPDMSATAFAQPIEWPYIVGPTGMARLFHPDGEGALARAAATAGTIYCLSTMSSQSLEDVAAASSGPKAFQLYVFRDRGVSRMLIDRAKRAGFRALIVTVDVQVPANRESDMRLGMTVPPRFTARSILDMVACPRWCWNMVTKPLPVLANFADMAPAKGMSLMGYVASLFEPAVSWSDIEWIAREWGGPLVIKGILRPDDACRAIDAGASSVILSNHGGRQMDASAASIDILPRVVDAMRGRGDIILDSGIRRGSDILKALALGANGTMGGRPTLYGLAAAGEAGAARALQLLRSEVERDMTLCGVSSVKNIDSSYVMAKHSPYPGVAAT